MVTVMVVGVVLAAAGGLLAAVSAHKILKLSTSIAERVENVEQRLLVTQLRLLSESQVSEAFYIDQVSSTLKTSMIEDAIADGRHTSEAFNAQIAAIDKRREAVAVIQREARQRGEQNGDQKWLTLGPDKLGQHLDRAERQLVRLRQVKKHFEKKLEAYRAGEQFFGDDTVQ